MRIAGKDKTICRKKEGQDLKAVCAESCEASCNGTIEQYVADTQRATGLAVDEAVKARVLKSCVRNCRTECGKPGKVFNFIVPSRR